MSGVNYEFSFFENEQEIILEAYVYKDRADDYITQDLTAYVYIELVHDWREIKLSGKDEEKFGENLICHYLSSQI